jgi:hypothetical protein
MEIKKAFRYVKFSCFFLGIGTGYIITGIIHHSTFLVACGVLLIILNFGLYCANNAVIKRIL